MAPIVELLLLALLEESSNFVSSEEETHPQTSTSQPLSGDTYEVHPDTQIFQFYENQKFLTYKDSGSC